MFQSSNMKYLAGTLLLILFLACNSNRDQQADDDTTAAGDTPDTTVTFSPVDTSSEFIQTFSSNLQPWLERTTRQTTLRLENFRYADNWVEDSLVVTAANLTPDFYRTYKPVLVYSPDSSKVLDLGSYGAMLSKNAEGKTTMVQGEPDSEIAVLDRLSRKRRRIFFFGPGSTVEHGFWLNDSTVLLAGKTEDSATNAPKPIIWTVKLDRNSNMYTRYEPQ